MIVALLTVMILAARAVRVSGHVEVLAARPEWTAALSLVLASGWALVE